MEQYSGKNKRILTDEEAPKIEKPKHKRGIHDSPREIITKPENTAINGNMM